MKYSLSMLCVILASWHHSSFAAERIELDTTTIKGNTELPKYMYVVPWQDKKAKKPEDQKLVLHNLYSDLFDPVMPDYIPSDQFTLKDIGDGP